MGRKRGAALTLVVVVFSVLMILGSIVLILSLVETKHVLYQEDEVKSHYAARAGADAVASYLIQNPDALDEFIQKTKVGPATSSIDGRDLEIYVSGTEHEFIIESKVFYKGAQEATIYLTMREFDLLDSAIFANEVLITGNNVTINGDIGTNQASIDFGNVPINGDIMLGPDATPSDIDDAEASIAPGYLVNVLGTPIIFPPIDEALFTVSLPTGTTEINTATEGLTDGQLRRKLDSIDIGGNTVFRVYGGGDVHLLVTDEITVGGLASVGTDANTRLFIYYNKSDTITFAGTPGSNITLYAPHAAINYNGGGNGENVGSFICDTFNGPDSGSCSITKGNASVDELLIEGVAGYLRAIWSK